MLSYGYMSGALQGGRNDSGVDAAGLMEFAMILPACTKN
jgi:hypothetical protein